MKQNLLFRIDYISFRLTEMFNINSFWNWCEREELDTKTGEKSVNLRPDQFDTWYNGGKNTGISVFRGGELKCLDLIRNYALPVTRLDLACTIPFGSEESAEDARAEMVARVRGFFETVGINPTIATIEGQARQGNGFNTTSFWGRAGEKQLRIYAKTLEDSQGIKRGAVRVEWQLRGAVASKTFEALEKFYPKNPRELFNAFQSVTSEYLTDDFFELGKFTKLDVKPAVEKTDKPNLQLWLDRIVIPSLVRQQNSTGFEGGAYVAMRVEQILRAQETEKFDRQKTLQQKKVDKVKHGIAKKLAKGVERDGGLQSETN